jgi:hypothetical protein
LVTLKECINAHSEAVISAEDEPMLQYVSVQAARLIDVKVFTQSEWSNKVLSAVCCSTVGFEMRLHLATSSGRGQLLLRQLAFVMYAQARLYTE